jgi:hypothetical protein
MANSLLKGKLTGNFAVSRPQGRFLRLIDKHIQRLAMGFPARQNREFPNAYQGKFFKEQGIFTRNASILNFEQPQPPYTR